MLLIDTVRSVLCGFFVVLISSSLLTMKPAFGEMDGAQVFLKEDFNDLSDWKDLHFRKIKEHTAYSVVNEGSMSYLKAESNASASGLVLKKEFSVKDYPVIKWRWKVNNVYEKGNAQKKSGDDYPMRIYVMFKYDPDNAPFGKKFRYGLAKKLYGEYPPHSSLNYIWANRPHASSIITNAYAKEAQMILLQTGNKRAGTWIDQTVHIVEDYQKAFGRLPPETASLAIMNDSDNTKEHSLSYIDYIMVTGE